MVDDKEDVLLKPTTFKGKIEERTPDILVVLLILLVSFEVWDGRRKGVIPQNNNVNVNQAVKSVKNIDQVRTIHFNDTVRAVR